MLLDQNFELAQQPIPGPQAFGETNSAALQSQAALFLLMGARRRGDFRTSVNRSWASGGFAARQPAVEPVDSEDLQAINPVPRLRGPFERVEPEISEEMSRGFAAHSVAENAASVQPTPVFLRQAAEVVYNEPTVRHGAMLLEMGLRHPYELPRVAAAISYFDLSAEPTRALPILVRGALSSQRLVREVATTALARLAPEQLPILQSLRENMTSRSAPVTSSPTDPIPEDFLVHGTWARTATW